MKPAWLFAPTAGLLLGSAAPPPPPTLAYASFAEALPGCSPKWWSGCDHLTGTEERAPPPANPGATAAPAPAAGAPPAPTLKPRRWARSGAPGRLRVVVSIPQQRAYLFDGSRLLESSRVSTGRRGHETPVGTFRIMEKKVKHRSNRYANAPMPYMQRLTSYGIALHAGHLPGYPASHGCIRLPWGFARRLYDLTDSATIVTVTNRRPRRAQAALDLV
jgi:lipoprotein-anchoring transpeptidase ErfK/SrfK